MEEFRVVATVLSMVLGLGVTRLLLGLVTVFRTRATCRLDWLPLAWAGVVFLFMLQYWWTINSLPVEAAQFNFFSFLYFIFMTLFLFLAAALVLPNRPEDEVAGMQAFFDRDGRYALLALATFLACGLTANLIYFRVSIFSAWGLLEIPMIAIPCAVFMAASRGRKALLTAMYIPLCLVDLWVSLNAG